MTEHHELTCQQLREMAAELALGVLTGRERAAALDHLDRCDACRAEVRQLRETGVQLVELLPPAEPPAGFETRVLARLGLPPQPAVPAEPPVPPLEPQPPLPARSPGQTEPRTVARPGRRRWSRPTARVRRALAAAAVAVAVAGAGLGGWRIGAGSPTPATAGAPLSTAHLLSTTAQDVGTVYLFSGARPWLYMSVDLDAGDERVTCQVVSADGRVTTVGSFSLAAGYGSWGTDDPAQAGQLRGARLVSASGTVLATAAFST